MNFCSNMILIIFRRLFSIIGYYALYKYRSIRTRIRPRDHLINNIAKICRGLTIIFEIYQLFITHTAAMSVL